MTSLVASTKTAGSQICQNVLALQEYQEAKTIGIYLHCSKLREVDTTAILDDAQRQGAVGGGSGVQGPSRLHQPLLNTNHRCCVYVQASGAMSLWSKTSRRT